MRKILKNDLENLLEISIELSKTQNLKTLLDKIIFNGRKITNCDAGTIYLLEENKLKFFITQSDFLLKKYGEKEFKNLFDPFDLLINEKSVAGYCALTQKSLNIKDVNNLDKKYPFKYNNAWDLKTGYTTKSMLVIPLIHSEIGLVGVLQLINALDEEGNIIEFSHRFEKILNVLASYAAIIIYNTKLHTKLKESYFDTVIKLAIASEYRDKETFEHLYRISFFTYELGKLINLPEEELEELKFASMMHDIGKIGIPDSILLKPGKFDEREKKIMESHTLIGANILRGSNSSLLKKAAKISLTHHEKWNGHGYPLGLKGYEIPLEGRIVSICDVFDALSSKRVYKDSFPIENVINMMKDLKGKDFDPILLETFLNNIEVILKKYEIEKNFIEYQIIEYIEPEKLLEIRNEFSKKIL
ncbi:MAG: HD domain-containing protein [Spirochaetes bacterium]|nr:HD domain-containing protein [Spirochaetota bacterium]